MESGTELLWIAACVTAVAAVALSTYGGGRRTQRGWASWRTALWLAAAGMLLAAVSPRSAWSLVSAQLLMLQWPWLTLQGVRRFHARIDWPADERLDFWVAGGCALIVLSGPLWPSEGGVGALTAPLASVVIHSYAASLLVGISLRPEGLPLRLLGIDLAAVSVVPMAFALQGQDGRSGLLAMAAATALGALVMAFIVIALATDRNERRLRASRRRLRALANIDSLTKVPNRRHFEELANRILQADPPGSAVLLLFDVDHFKHINDQLGHSAGDRALRLVSHCMVDALRVHDVPGRHGGDEFALLLRHASVRDALTVAERLMARLHVTGSDSQLPTLTLSFGVVQIRPTEMVDEALKRADQALYEAKRQGRARVVAASGNIERPVFTESQQLGLHTC